MLGKAILPILAFAATALAGQSIVKNKCSFPVYVTSVDSQPHETLAVAAGGIWAEPQRYDPLTGISIKVGTTADALWTSKPILQFAYTQHPEDWIYYDLSPSYGYDAAFVEKKLVVEGSAPGVPKIVCPGTPPAAQNTKAYKGYTDLIFILCA
jgi:hypothetical protein